MNRRNTSSRLVYLGAAVCAAAFGASLAGPARAASAPKPGASAVWQYVEMVPTGGGPAASGVGKEKKTPLPPRTQRELGRTAPATAKALATVATSSWYGAPATTLHPGTPPKTGAAPRGAAVPPAVRIQPSVTASLRTTFDAIGAGSTGRMLGLLAILVLTTLGGIAGAARRRDS